MQRFSILDRASFCPLFDKVWQWRDDDQDPATVSVLIQLFTQFSETLNQGTNPGAVQRIMFDAVTEVTKKARNRHNYASNRLNVVNYRQPRGITTNQTSSSSVAASTAAAMRPRSFQSVRSCPMAMWWTSTPQVHAVLFVSPNEYKDDPARTVANLAERFCAYFSTELANIKGELTALANSRDSEAARHHTGFLPYFTSFGDELTMPSDEIAAKAQVPRPALTTEPIQLSSDYFPETGPTGSSGGSGNGSGSRSASASARQRPGSSSVSSVGGVAAGSSSRAGLPGQGPTSPTPQGPGGDGGVLHAVAISSTTANSSAASPWASASQHSESRSRAGLPGGTLAAGYSRGGLSHYQAAGASDDVAESVSFELSTSGDQAYDWGVHAPGVYSTNQPSITPGLFPNPNEIHAYPPVRVSTELTPTLAKNSTTNPSHSTTQMPTHIPVPAPGPQAFTTPMPEHAPGRSQVGVHHTSVTGTTDR